MRLEASAKILSGGVQVVRRHLEEVGSRAVAAQATQTLVADQVGLRRDLGFKRPSGCREIGYLA